MSAPRWSYALFLALAWIALSSVSIGWAMRRTAAPSAAPLAQRLNEGQCGGEITTTLSANPVSICAAVTVTTRVEPRCPVCPDGVNIVFVHLGTPFKTWQFRESLGALEEAKRLTEPSSQVRAAVILYDHLRASVILRMTDDVSKIRTALNAAPSGSAAGVSVPHLAAQQAVQELRRASGKGKPCEFVIFFVYHKLHDFQMRDLILQAGRTILGAGVNLLVGCPMQGAWYCKGGEPEMPRSMRWFTEYNESGKLAGMVRDEISGFDRGAGIRLMTLSQDVPQGLSLVEGSASGEPAITPLLEGTRLHWAWDSPTAGKPYTVTFRLKPMALDRHTIGGEMKVTHGSGSTFAIPVPTLNLDVVDLCPTWTPTPTATDTAQAPPPPSLTPTPSAMRTATATRTPTATALPTVTPPPTPSIFKIYLPLLPWERCTPESVYTDAVLVLDMSTSMGRPTREGRSKHAAAVDAAKLFVGLLDFTPDERGGHDQIAVVGFNSAAWTAAGLSNDAAAIGTALDGLEQRMAQGTRLDLAFSQGQEALDSGPRRAANRPVLVLLTDGLPNQVPFPPGGRQEDTVLAAAGAVKGAGTRAFTIGLGEPDDVLRELLTAASSSPGDYSFAPDGEDLGAIYRRVAGRITGCP